MKITAKELLFLHNHNLVDTQLVEEYCKRNLPHLNPEKLWKGVKNVIRLQRWFLVSFFSALISGGALVTASQWNNATTTHQVIIYCVSFVFLVSIPCWITDAILLAGSTGRRFVKDINILVTTLNRGECSVLRERFEDLSQTAENHLKKLANKLNVQMKVNGIGTPGEVFARDQTIERHAILYRFNLCEKNPWAYRPDAPVKLCELAAQGSAKADPAVNPASATT